VSGAGGPAAPVRSVLIVRLSAVGDCVHALPAIAALRAARPDLRIGWAIDDRSAPLLAGLPEVDEFFVLPRRALAGKGLLARCGAFLALRRKLRAAGFQAAADLQGLAKSALVTLASGAPLRIGLGRAAGARELSWLACNCRPEVPAGARHVAERSAALLVPLGLPAGAALPLPRLPVHAGAAARVAGLLAELGLAARPFAVLNPGAGWETKRWPPGSFADLAASLRQELGLEVLITWFGAGERELAGMICSGGAARPAPETTLPELVELLRRSALCVGSDSGPAHIAAAAGTPTVALFGPADAVRNRPLGPAVEVLTAQADCAPCWRRRGCPRGLECMLRITPGGVLAAARRLLGEQAHRPRAAEARPPAPAGRRQP